MANSKYKQKSDKQLKASCFYHMWARVMTQPVHLKSAVPVEDKLRAVLELVQMRDYVFPAVPYTEHVAVVLVAVPSIVVDSDFSLPFSRCEIAQMIK